MSTAVQPKVVFYKKLKMEFRRSIIKRRNVGLSSRESLKDSELHPGQSLRLNGDDLDADRTSRTKKVRVKTSE